MIQLKLITISSSDLLQFYMTKTAAVKIPVLPLVAMVEKAASGEPSHAPWKRFAVGSDPEHQLLGYEISNGAI